MTPEHEEAFPYGEAVRLAEKHGGIVHHGPIAQRISLVIPRSMAAVVIGEEELAALIADVRRQKGEEDYEQGWREAAMWAKRTDLISDIGSPAYNTAKDERLDAIRARLDSPMGKEEGK